MQVFNEDAIRNKQCPVPVAHRASERSELQSAPCSTEEVDTDSAVGRGEGGRMLVRAAFSYERHAFALEQIYTTLSFLRNA